MKNKWETEETGYSNRTALYLNKHKVVVIEHYTESKSKIDNNILDALNNYDEMLSTNKILLEALGNTQSLISFVINAIPTGSTRNLLTDANIIALDAIKKSQP